MELSFLLNEIHFSRTVTLVLSFLLCRIIA